MGRPLSEEHKRKMAEGRARKRAALSAPTAQEIEQYSKQDTDNTPALVKAFELALEASQKKESQRDSVLVDALAESHRRLVKPENDAATIPRISAFNPRGDRDFPRPKLKCPKVFQCGFPFEESQATYEELEHMNLFIDRLLEAKKTGTSLPEFMVSKADGSQARVKLETKWNEFNGTLEELHINYPVVTIDMRSGLYSFLFMLKEMLGLEQPNVDVPALQARLRALETENAALRLMR